VLSGTGAGSGGYVSSDALIAMGRFPSGEPAQHWWLPSGRAFLSPDVANDAAAEFAHAKDHFFLPYRFVDPFGQTTSVAYDGDAAPYRNHNLLPVRHRDPVGNVTIAANDYRVLLPVSMTDPNGNRTEVRFDALGEVAGTAVMGKADSAMQEGDSFADFTADLDPETIRAFFDASDPRSLALVHLGLATTRLLYDLDRVPACAATISRETHVADLEQGEETRLQLSFGYSDGLGRQGSRRQQCHLSGLCYRVGTGVFAEVRRCGRARPRLQRDPGRWRRKAKAGLRHLCRSHI